jgi:hypothetical protein
VRIIYAWSSATADRRRETGRSGAKTTTATKDRTPRRRRPRRRRPPPVLRHVSDLDVWPWPPHAWAFRVLRRRDASHLSAWDPSVIRHWVTCLRDETHRRGAHAAADGDYPHSWTSIFNLYIHYLYVLVSKILFSIFNSPAHIHLLYHPLSTISTVGPTCHFI